MFWRHLIIKKTWVQLGLISKKHARRRQSVRISNGQTLSEASDHNSPKKKKGNCCSPLETSPTTVNRPRAYLHYLENPWNTRKLTVIAVLGWLLVSTLQTICNCKFTWQMASMPCGIFQLQYVSNENPSIQCLSAKTNIPTYSCLSSFVDTFYNGLYYSDILICNCILFLCCFLILSPFSPISHPPSLFFSFSLLCNPSKSSTFASVLPFPPSILLWQCKKTHYLTTGSLNLICAFKR